MIKKSIVFQSEKVYNDSKASAAHQGKNLMTPDKKKGVISWAEEAFIEKLERDNEQRFNS